MQIDYFDIDNTPDAQAMVLLWPMKFVAYNYRDDKVRIYYVVMPGATDQTGTFYCVKSEQPLPETFPAQLLSTVFPKTLTGVGGSIDDALHLFFVIPVNKPKKPRAVKSSGGQKTKEVNGNGGADSAEN